MVDVYVGEAKKEKKKKSMDALLEVFYTSCMDGLVFFGDGGGSGGPNLLGGEDFVHHQENTGQSDASI